MTKGTLRHDMRLLGSLALAAAAATVAASLMQGGLSMELGDLLLSVRPHQDGGLIVSFVTAH